MKSLLLTATIFLSAICMAGNVNAAIVTISFSGVITSISDPSGQLSGSDIGTATTFSGVISYDSSLTPLFVGPSAGGVRAFYSPTTAIITIAGFEYSVGDVILVDDYAPGTGSDKLWKSTGGGVPSVSSCFGTFTGCNLNITLWDTTGSLFTDTVLPTSVTLSDFDIHTIEIQTVLDFVLQYQINGTITSLNSTVAGNRPPVAADTSITAVSEALIYWTPMASDPDGDALTCRLGTPPQNGAATIATDCSSGTYRSDPGFIGTDSFTYLANDGRTDSAPATVTVAVTEGSVDQICVQNNPISQFTQTGKEGTLTIAFTGNITSYTNKAVKVCPGTTLKYTITSTQGPVVCRVKNNTTQGSGSLKINDHIKCTDKPAGKDKLGFKVKSGAK